MCFRIAPAATHEDVTTMAKVADKLTDILIARATLAPGERQKQLWDTKVTGFHVRILPASKTYGYQYRTAGGRAGTTRMMRIGKWPDIKLDVARDTAHDYANQVALARRGHGEDPSAAKQEAKRAAAAKLSALIAVDGEYEKHLKRRKIVNVKTIMSGLRRGLAKLGAKDVYDVTRADLVAAITAIEDQGKPGAAQDLRKFAHTLCEWCVKRGFAPSNVLAGLKREKLSRAEKIARGEKRARALPDHEIVAVWNACEGFGAFGRIMRMSLLCATRRSEVAKLTCDKILSDRLVLPPLSTKSGEQHEVPMTELMRLVIASQHKTTSKFVFPSERTGGTVSGWSKLLPKLQKASGVTFTPHDLRRTCRTVMSQYRVDHDVAELAIGHARQGLDKLYDFAELWDLRSDAFAKVSDHVARLLGEATEPGKVVAIR
jgi:integrase